MAEPLDDAETLRLGGDRILKIGRRPQNYENIHGRYTHLIRISAGLATQSVNAAWELLASDSSTFVTILLQHLIDKGVGVQAARVRTAWLEIDRTEDLIIDSNPF